MWRRADHCVGWVLGNFPWNKRFIVGLSTLAPCRKQTVPLFSWDGWCIIDPVICLFRLQSCDCFSLYSPLLFIWHLLGRSPTVSSSATAVWEQNKKSYLCVGRVCEMLNCTSDVCGANFLYFCDTFTLPLSHTMWFGNQVFGLKPHQAAESVGWKKGTLNMLKSSQIIYIVLELVIAILAVAGNILVCWAVCLNSNLQNITNFFVVSLAVADIAVGLLAIPFAITIRYNSMFMFRLILSQGLSLLLNSFSLKNPLQYWFLCWLLRLPLHCLLRTHPNPELHLQPACHCCGPLHCYRKSTQVSKGDIPHN